MILVTGAAGKTGRAVIQALSRREVRVRALVRSQAQVPAVKRVGADEAIVGDMRDPDTLHRSAAGARALYHICPNMHSEEVSIGQTIIAAAVASGIEHFVYHSVLHPQIEAMPHHWHKMRVEELLFASGLDYTILQPAAYMQNILAGWSDIVERGRYRVPYSPHTRLALVDLLDVAEAAAIVLTETGHRFATYELCGPECLSQTQVATVLGEVLGRPVVVDQVPIPAWRKQAEKNQLGDSQIQMLVKMFDYYDRHGLVGNSWHLERLLSRPPTDLAAFVKRFVGRNGEV
jgi:NAD(P)H dehydrogenase (quinone)